MPNTSAQTRWTPALQAPVQLPDHIKATLLPLGFPPIPDIKVTSTVVAEILYMFVPPP